MDDKKYEFLPDDFEFIGDKQNINIDEVAPARPAWKDVVYRLLRTKVQSLVQLVLLSLLYLLSLYQ